MLRALRVVVLGVAGAVAGALGGHIAADIRRQLEAGLSPSIDPARIELRPRDVVPGLLAALRSGDRPWSYLHIPAWFVAFAVNFALGAFSEELEPVRKAAGLDLFDGGDEPSAPIEGEYVEVAASDLEADAEAGAETSAT